MKKHHKRGGQEARKKDGKTQGRKTGVSVPRTPPGLPPGSDGTRLGGWQTPNGAGIPRPEDGDRVFWKDSLWYSKLHGFYLYDPDSRHCLINGRVPDRDVLSHFMDVIGDAWRNRSHNVVAIRMVLGKVRPRVKRLSHAEAKEWSMKRFMGDFFRYAPPVTTSGPEGRQP